MSGNRTTGRIKKPKAVFDPSDNYLPRKIGNSSQKLTISSPPNSVASGSISSKRLSQSSTISQSSIASTIVAAEAVTCYVCMKKEVYNKKALKSKLINCVDCGNSVHKTCLKTEFEDVDVLRQNYKCSKCSVCCACDTFDGDNADPNVEKLQLITCSRCVKSYHPTCHIPNVLKFQQQNANWQCNKCSASRNIKEHDSMPVQAIREIIGDDPKMSNNHMSISVHQSPHKMVAVAENAPTQLPNVLTSKKVVKTKFTERASNGIEADSKNHDETSAKRPKIEPKKVEEALSTTTATVAATTVKEQLRHNPNDPLDIPDVKDWSVDQVYRFFAKQTPNEAHVFKEHEIDGLSLLLLKRSDIIKKLSLKLGPSLRLYNLILKIQTKTNDPTLGWN